MNSLNFDFPLQSTFDSTCSQKYSYQDYSPIFESSIFKAEEPLDFDPKQEQNTLVTSNIQKLFNIKKRRYNRSSNVAASPYSSKRWTPHEKWLYQTFLDKNVSNSDWKEKSSNKKRNNYFVEMSKFIQTKSPSQCKSFDQKAEKKKKCPQEVSCFSDSIFNGAATTRSQSQIASNLTNSEHRNLLFGLQPLNSIRPFNADISSYPLEPKDNVDNFFDFGLMTNFSSKMHDNYREIDPLRVQESEDLDSKLEKDEESFNDGTEKARYLKVIRRCLLDKVKKLSF